MRELGVKKPAKQEFWHKFGNFLGSLNLIIRTVVFWGSIIGQKIFAQNRGFIIGKVVKNMISEGKQR